MIDKVINLISNKDLTISKLLIRSYKDLKITSDELIVLTILINNSDNALDINKFSQELSLKSEKVLELIYSLVSKDIVKISNIKEKNILKEIYSLEPLYKKLSFFVINDNKKEDSTIYSKFEEEFGRLLSKMEYEIINGWLEAGFDETMIIDALKEAVYNNVSNLRYVDVVLHNWKKNGIKNREDKIKAKEVETVHVDDIDWLNE